MTELALRTTIVLALAFAAAAALRRATPATRHLLWHTTMLLVVAAPLLQAVIPDIEGPLPVTRSIETTIETVSQLATADIPSASQNRNPEPARLAPSASSLAVTALWAFGFTVAGFWFALSWLASLWIAGRGTAAPARIQMEAHAIAKALGARRAPDVRLQASAHGPVTVGLVAPVILLPPIAIEWHVERRRAVLAHEIAHVRRGDTRTQALAHAACALYWFNPLAWMAARAMRRERERACDDAVVALGIRPSTYAQDLLDIAQGVGRRSPSAALAMARKSELEGRLMSLLSAGRARRPARASKWIVVCATTLWAVGAFGLQAGGAARHPDALTSAPLRASFGLERSIIGTADQREQTRRAVEALAGSDSEDVREWAALELAVSSDAAVIDALIDALDDSSAQVREKAAIGLSLRRDPRVVDALLAAAADEDAQVREKVMMALATSGDPRAIAVLRAGVGDGDAQVREKAAMGLVLLTTSPMGPIDRAELESGFSWLVNRILRAVR